jgi:two-component system response regulator FixJ
MSSGRRFARRGVCEVPQSSDQQVLLIDEDEIVRDSLKVLLESHGVSVRDFRTPSEFLAMDGIAAGGCLVLGYNRRIAGGLDLMTTLRRRGSALPVIFIVGGGDALAKAEALTAGAFAYLERPIEEAALIRAIKAALGRRSGLNAGPQPAPAGAEAPVAAQP